MNRLLVVEDDEASSEMLVELFEDEGYQVTAALTAQEALDALRSLPFEAVLMDLTLPGYTSEALVQAVAAIERCPPLVIFSARPPMETTYAGRTLQAVAVLTKPADLDTLLETVAKAARRATRPSGVELTT